MMRAAVVLTCLWAMACVPLEFESFEGELECEGTAGDIELHVDHFASEAPFGFLGLDDGDGGFVYIGLSKRDISGADWNLETDRVFAGDRLELDLTRRGKTLEGEASAGEADCDVDLEVR